MVRPLLRLGIPELKAMYGAGKTDRAKLEQLEDELRHRQVPYAVSLLSEVQDALKQLSAPTTASPTSVVPVARSGPPHAPEREYTERPSAPLVRAAPPVAPLRASPPPAKLVEPVPPAAPKRQESLFPQGVEYVKSAPRPPAITLDSAYKVLKATRGTAWEDIEGTRRMLVRKANPTRLRSLSPEQRSKALADARLVNAAYARLSEERPSKL